MITKGQEVHILPQWQDAGDDKFKWFACHDEDGGLVEIAPRGVDLPFPPIYTVRTDMLQEGAQEDGIKEYPITLVGSNGSLTADPNTGIVLSTSDDGTGGGGYPEISQVDVGPLKKWASSLNIDIGQPLDILFAGYWTRDNEFSPPEEDYLREMGFASAQG